MTNQVSADPHPVVGTLPTPPIAWTTKRAGWCIFVCRKVNGTHFSCMETSYFIFGASHLLCPQLGRKTKLHLVVFYSLQILSPWAITEVNPAEHCANG